MTNKYETMVKPHLKEIIEQRSSGASMEDLTEWLGVSRAMFWRYVNTYPELKEAMDEANDVKDHVLLETAKHSLLNKLTDRTVKTEQKIVDGVVTEEKMKMVPADTTAIIFTLKALDAKTWDPLGVARINTEQEDVNLSKEIVDRLDNYSKPKGGSENEVPKRT